MDPALDPAWREKSTGQISKVVSEKKLTFPLRLLLLHLMLSSITHVCPDDAPAKNSREGAAKNAGSKHPASPEPRPSGAGFPPQKKLKQGTQAAPGGRVIFPKAIKVLIVHKTLWCTCAECTEARLLVCAHSHSGGLLQHKEVDAVIQRARGDLESMRQLLTSSRVIVAVHPDARAGSPQRLVQMTRTQAPSDFSSSISARCAVSERMRTSHARRRKIQSWHSWRRGRAGLLRPPGPPHQRPAMRSAVLGARGRRQRIRDRRHQPPMDPCARARPRVSGADPEQAGPEHPAAASGSAPAPPSPLEPLGGRVCALARLSAGRAARRAAPLYRAARSPTHCIDAQRGFVGDARAAGAWAAVLHRFVHKLKETAAHKPTPFAVLVAQRADPPGVLQHDKKLFVGGIPWTFDSEDLREVIARFNFN